MRVVTTAIQHLRGHMGQHTHEASEDDTAVSTFEGILRVCAKVKSLSSESVVLRQQLKGSEEVRNSYDLSVSMRSDNT